MQQNFQQENNKGLLFTMSWSGQLLSFVLCSCSSQKMLPLQWSDANWGEGPPHHRLLYPLAQTATFWRIVKIQQAHCKTLGSSLQICRSWPKSRHWGWGGDGLGRHLVPPLLAVNCSYFALFYGVTWHLSMLLMLNIHYNPFYLFQVVMAWLILL
jgi:hypothetical protein